VATPAVPQINPPPTPGVNYAVTPPNAAMAQYVRTALEPYGKWVEVPSFGSCWRPNAALVDPKWRPYDTQGRWFYTEFGWFWHSDYSWGPIVFHYGRWFQDNGAWVWMPGYDWASAWVCWREAEGYFGWAPLPPSVTFQSGVGVIWDGKAAGNSDFGLGANAFMFVSYANFREHDLHAIAVPAEQAEAIFKTSTVKNGYRMEQGKFIVDGPGHDYIAKAINHEIPMERPFIRSLTGN
jgi:hypothetical protein